MSKCLNIVNKQDINEDK